MDLSSYADLALDLVNTRHPSGDGLGDLDGLQALLAHRPHLGGRITRRDLDAMRELRDELRAVFAAADRGDEEDAAERLNALLIQHPVHPQLSGHDAQGWHLHLNEGGSIPDRYAARAAMGLAVHISDRGMAGLGICAAEGCDRVYLDTTGDPSRHHCPAHTPRATAAAHHHPPRHVTVPLPPHPR
ncbi:ABATE domain-containing protein [Actinomadura sp. NPDC047616]|uniref:CGNR zinc finger domain-containing protein n=1 Tax=Actinomadura sp. NPDC047616 TaxID=3155914 RepID=UPI0033D6E84F